MSTLTRQIRQRLGWCAWLRAWRTHLLLRLGLIKPTPPRYDADYFEAMCTWDKEER